LDLDYRLEEVLSNLSPHVNQIIVVNDGSTDASPEIIRRFLEGREGVTCLSTGENRGKGAALRDGFEYAVHLLEEGRIAPEDIIVTLDADGQHWSPEIPRVAAFMEERGFDAVVTQRDLSEYPLYKRVGNYLLTLNARLLSGLPYRDSECGFRLLRAGLLSRILPLFTGVRYSCEQEISVLLGCLRARVTNEYRIAPVYYRSNTRLKDAFLNVAMGWIAFLRARFGIQYRPAEPREAVVARAILSSGKTAEGDCPSPAT